MIVDDEDADLAQTGWSVFANTKARTTYACCRRNKKTVLMHRVILERKIGRALLPGEHVDHINGDGCDNLRRNLRVATNRENSRNQTRPRCGKRFKGIFVDHRNGRWTAQINPGDGGGSRHLGCFATEEEAAACYDAAAKELFGEFASLNFPERNIRHEGESSS